MIDSGAQKTLVLTEIQRLRTLVTEVSAALHSQQEILRTRGMNLPPGALKNLDHIDTDLKDLEKNLGEEETELAQLRALAATSAMINSSLDLDEVLNNAMGEVIKLAGAERGYFVLKNPETGQVEFRVARDLTDTDGRGGTTFQGSNTILNEVLETGEPLLSDNAYKDPRVQDNNSIAQMVLRSVLCVPLNYKSEVIGAVYVDNRLRAGVFTEREKSVLVAFANQATVAIENARLFMRVQNNLAEITELSEVMANVFDSIGSGIITADASDEVETFNAAASGILGFSEDVALGQHLEAVLPKLSPEFLQRVRENNETQAIESEIEMERGRVYLSLKLSPLKDAEQQTRGVAVVVDDLTEQHEREERLKTVERYLPRGMVEHIEQISGLALGGERREMTCMYVDVRSLATMPPDLRPTQVMDLLNEYLSVVTECVQATSGVIDKYMGTEVMILYNTQLNPMPDHAYRALESALLIRDEFVNLYARQGINPDPHFYRIGIHSGVATTGNVGSANRRDFTALGDTINLAHRLLENATPGQIIISDALCDYMRAVSGGVPQNIRMEERQAIKAKGRQQATSVYEVFKA
ncbi:MAG: GAF domain-containing protein [Anaerolineae bacterium]|nr:GAF domain-containing protein [Anaerolineae bacterium]